MVSERYLHIPRAAYWVWGDPMLPAVSPYASLFLQSAVFICISTLTAFKQSQRFSLLLFLAVCNVSSRVHPGRLVLSNGTKLQNCRCSVCAEMRAKRARRVFFAHLRFVFFTCAKNLVFWSCQKLQAITFQDMHAKIPPWKSYSKRMMCVCGKWGALKYNIIIPAKLVWRFIDLLHKGPSKIKQTWRTGTPIPWMLSVIHWPCPRRLVILLHAV